MCRKEKKRKVNVQNSNASKRPRLSGKEMEALLQGTALPVHVAILHNSLLQEQGARQQIVIMSTTTETGSRLQKDGHNSAGGLFSKASSSLRRSPSKKKAQTSTPMPSLDGPFLEHTTTQAGSTSKRTYRPGFQRAPTAPAAPQSTNVSRPTTANRDEEEPQSAIEANMLNAPFSNLTKPLAHSKSADATPTSAGPMQLPSNGLAAPNLTQERSAAPNTPNPNVLYQHIQDMSNKRIATLDYIRKAHEGQSYWFNTIHFSKADLSKLPNFTPARLARRATNYFLLGLSIPAALDIHSQSHPQAAPSANAFIAQEYLRSLNTLLTEFETFQQHHPPDGSTASSLSRARLPQMFKRTTSSKPRRSTGGAGVGVTEIGLPMQQITVSSPAVTNGSGHAANPSVDTTSTSFSSAPTLVNSMPPPPIPQSSFPPSSSFPLSTPAADSQNSSLLPNEGPYTHLLTPPLPFAPDFFAVFATLCDVLIDAYQRLLGLLSSPDACTIAVGEMFAKADARVRKVVVQGVVRDFEAASREGVRRELVGVQRVVLGGLMGS